MSVGVWQAVGAYVIWGLLTVFWKSLSHIPAAQQLGHRIVWSFLTLIGVIWVLRQQKVFRDSALRPGVLRVYALTGALIGVNWMIYIWSVNHNFIVEASLGYFINPLLSVALGVIFLRERLRPVQWIPIGLAGLGVLYLTFAYGSLPWIALSLATTFGLYGLLKKTAPLGSLYGLTLETAFLFLPALAVLIWSEVSGVGAFLHSDLVSDLLLASTGVATAVPLLMFASAARKIPLSLVGLLQYITPTLQFLIGVLVYHEPFSSARFIGFGIVWVALIIFGVEGFLFHRRHTTAPE